jgi:hypothetical protein
MADAPATSATREPAAPPAAVHAAVSAAQAQSFDSLLAFSDSVFTVLSLADATILYVSPNVRRIFNMSPAAVLGCAGATRVCVRIASRAQNPRRLSICAAHGHRCAHRVPTPAHATAACVSRPLAARARRRSLLVCCTEEDAQQTLRALISAVRAAPPHSAPATARVRRRVASASGEDVWVWAEIKLYSEARKALRARRRLHAASPAPALGHRLGAQGIGQGRAAAAACGGGCAELFARASQGEYIYAITRDVSGEKRIEDTLRAFLQSTRHASRKAGILLCHASRARR